MLKPIFVSIAIIAFLSGPLAAASTGLLGTETDPTVTIPDPVPVFPNTSLGGSINGTVFGTPTAPDLGGLANPPSILDIQPSGCLPALSGIGSDLLGLGQGGTNRTANACPSGEDALGVLPSLTGR